MQQHTTHIYTSKHASNVCFSTKNSRKRGTAATADQLLTRCFCLLCCVTTPPRVEQSLTRVAVHLSESAAAAGARMGQVRGERWRAVQRARRAERRRRRRRCCCWRSLCANALFLPQCCATALTSQDVSCLMLGASAVSCGADRITCWAVCADMHKHTQTLHLPPHATTTITTHKH